MNAKYFISALLLTSFFVSLSAQRVAPEVKLDGLRGNVKYITTIQYEALDEGKPTLVRGDILERVETEYMKNGQRKSMSYISPEEDVLFRSRYKHDGFGVTTLEHVVDDKENIIGRTYYVYDKQFFLTEVYVEDAERQIETRTMIKYDDNARVSERAFTDASGNVFRREVYAYAHSGNMVKTVTFDRKGTKIRETRYEYDEHHNPVTMTTYDYSEPETEISISLFRYLYDNNNNWIQKTEYLMVDNNPEAQTIIEREIKYF